MLKGSLTALLMFASPVAFACETSSIEVKSESGKFRFAIDVADDNEERMQGLMHVEHMDRFKGMLFIYPDPLEATFWMKNTLIPLDMLFADPTGTVTTIHENATPLSEATIYGGKNILYVLEINGGMASQLGITEGSVLRHPAIDPEIAAWSCPE